MPRLYCFIACLLISSCVALAATPTTWPSATTGTVLHGEIIAPSSTTESPLPTIVYLKNLSIPRLGQEPDDSIIGDLTKDGYLVLVLDYDHNPKAISPDLNADMLKLRQDIADSKHATLLTDYKVDPAHLYMLVEGFRLKRDVEFARDGQRVLGIDVFYPSRPTHPVPALMEITCDNVNRMGSFSLLFCHDTLVEGAQAAGFASAMVDHPVAPPYKGLDDPMPQSLYRMKAAVRTLRSLGDELDLNGKIGVIGFSRGGPFAAMLAVTNGRDDLEGDIESHRDVSSDVQAALIHGNRYDYLDLLPNDPMLARFAKAWGPRETSADNWAKHGAAYYLPKNPADAKKIAAMFLNSSNAESPEYQKGLADFEKRLTALGVEHVYQVDQDNRGHHVSTDPQTLKRIYDFFGKHLR